MTDTLPYLPTPGSIRTGLERIRDAATPDRVTIDFIQTKLAIKGGTGASIAAFLKKIGLVNSDASPSELYKRFRNTQTSGESIAEAMRIGYRELFDINEYCYALNDKDLLSLVCQATGSAADSQTAKLTVATFKNLKAFADFDAKSKAVDAVPEEAALPAVPAYRASTNNQDSLGLNLSYTINLNLPATSDQAVFNAIFRSLREHLLNGE
ncbi:hypothetical protein GFL38_20395 [Rhizobium leguminosarum bv. viciae]|uniref:DUF5343 domain-containing protein n=1 Tax=Rhizobium ruizarguesonis TaxID=2081791 RepID=UPI00143F7CDB|nr:DUF5343 domain-containing protein [Rhizobium ruizarguesonis]NKJ74584.1 hypothetical protein [Rhizobium leguminosarum bv. viciae]NKQ73781.1 hypothetical protein [Rhizobium ruizarguesonis]NKQ79733.1 hypothetical protein [Rhizobium ruizarguesonis]